MVHVEDMQINKQHCACITVELLSPNITSVINKSPEVGRARDKIYVSLIIF